MVEYIERQALQQDIHLRYCKDCNNHNKVKCKACWVDDMLGEIAEAPTADVVEVVRCKDCKHRRESVYRSYCLPVFGLKRITDLNGFCSYGERK